MFYICTLGEIKCHAIWANLNRHGAPALKSGITTFKHLFYESRSFDLDAVDVWFSGDHGNVSSILLLFECFVRDSINPRNPVMTP